MINMKWIQAADNNFSYGRIRFSLEFPRVLLIDDFLSEYEINCFVRESDTRLSTSTVINNDSGEGYVMEGRISKSAHFGRGEFEWMKDIENRIEQLTGLPVVNGEPFQVQRYDISGLYNPHYDWFDRSIPGTAKHLENSGQRVATVILYLKECESGGSTYFPNLNLRIRPYKGSALYFQNTDENVNELGQMLHGGDVVTSGVKYIATKWIRERSY